MSRQEAERLLRMEGHVGSFLFRESLTRVGTLVLSYRCGLLLYHPHTFTLDLASAAHS